MEGDFRCRRDTVQSITSRTSVLSQKNELLKKYMVQFVENLQPAELYAELLSNDVITREMLENIKAEKTREDKVRALLDIITRRSECDYEIFVQALHKSKHGFLARLLECGEDGCMTENQRRLLITNLKHFERDLILNDLFGKLISAEIFTEHMIEDIKAERTRTSQARKLILDLTRRGALAFGAFHQILKNTKQIHLAELLEGDVKNMLSMIPALPENFTGREEDVNEIWKYFQEGASRGCIIRGGPGVGKTTVAVAVATKISRENEREMDIIFCGREVDTVKGLGTAILTNLGIPYSEESVLQTALIHLSNSTKPVLIICDNVDNFISDASKRDEFINFIDRVRNCRQIDMLITCREIFHTESDWKYKKIRPLSEEDAVELMKSSCNVHEDILEDFVTVCGCVPLAINLIAKLLKSGDIRPKTLLKKLRSPRKGLNAYKVRHLPKEKQLDHLIGLSYERLEENLQNVIDFLSVFPASFDLLQACKLFQRSEDDMYEELLELVQSSILEYDEENVVYSLHPLVRTFACDRCYKKGYQPEEFQKAANRLGRSAEGLECYETAIRLHENKNTNRVHLMKLYNEMFWVLQYLGKYSKLLECAVACISLHRYVDSQAEKDSILESYYNLAYAYRIIGKEDKALETLTNLSQISVGENKDLAADYFWLLGELQRGKSNIDKALDLFNISKGYADMDTHHYAYAVISMSGIYRDQGEYGKSLQELQALQDMRDNNNSQPSEIDALLARDMGNNQYKMENFSASLECFHRAVDIYGKKLRLSDNPEVAGCWYNMAKSYAKLNQWENSLEAHRKALNIRQLQNGTHLDTVASKMGIGRVLAHLERHEEALAIFEESLNMMKEINERDQYCSIIRKLIATERRHLGLYDTASLAGNEYSPVRTSSSNRIFTATRLSSSGDNEVIPRHAAVNKTPKQRQKRCTIS